MNAVSYSDEAIFLALKGDNNIALKLLYKAHFPMVLNFILINKGTEQEAKDIYQECIIIFYEKLKSEGFKLRCQIKTYIYSICRRLWLKKLNQKSKYINNLKDHENYIVVEEEKTIAEDNEKRMMAMHKALHHLGEPCRTILKDYYMHELTMEEISEKFGYTNADNAKNQKYKCLQRLKKKFFSIYQNQEDNI